MLYITTHMVAIWFLYIVVVSYEEEKLINEEYDLIKIRNTKDTYNKKKYTFIFEKPFSLWYLDFNISFFYYTTTPLFCKVIEKSKRQNFQREKLLGLLWNCCNSWIIDQHTEKLCIGFNKKVLHITNCLQRNRSRIYYFIPSIYIFTFFRFPSFWLHLMCVPNPTEC